MHISRHQDAQVNHPLELHFGRTRPLSEFGLREPLRQFFASHAAAILEGEVESEPGREGAGNVAYDITGTRVS